MEPPAPAVVRDKLKPFRLLATDLDGTLLGRPEDVALITEFRETLDACRGRRSLLWVVCTGRSPASFRKSMRVFELGGVRPDYLVARHALIYSVSPRGWYIPHLWWNLQSQMHLRASRRIAASVLREWRDLVCRMFPGVVKTLAVTPERLSLRFRNAEDRDVAGRVLETRAATFRHLSVLHYANELDIRFVPYTKGWALAELAAHLDVQADEVLAIGDGHNDISMLNGMFATMTACPANAQPEVILAVHRTHGHVATTPTLAGVIESLRAYRDDAVNSRLPLGWQPPGGAANPSPARQPRRATSVPVRQLWFVAATVYVVLLALASFGLVPFVSGLLMRPYRVVLDAVLGRWFAQ